MFGGVLEAVVGGRKDRLRVHVGYNRSERSSSTHTEHNREKRIKSKIKGIQREIKKIEGGGGEWCRSRRGWVWCTS